MFGFRKKEKQQTYDPAEWTPVLKSSICTGETAAGFRNNRTKQFREEMLIRSPQDLEAFRRQYGITEPLEKIY